MRNGFLVAALLVAAPGCDDESPAKPDFVDRAVPSRLAPRPVRRLTHVEYRHTVRDLFPAVQAPDPGFVADAPIDGFDNHAATQNPSSLLIEQYRTAAAQIADLAADSEAPDCGARDGACLRAWVSDLGRRVFRRPLGWREALDFGGLAAAWAAKPGVGVRGATRLVLRAMLQAPQFLYRIELGAAGGVLGRGCGVHAGAVQRTPPGGPVGGIARAGVRAPVLGHRRDRGGRR